MVLSIYESTNAVLRASQLRPAHGAKGTRNAAAYTAPITPGTAKEDAEWSLHVSYEPCGLIARQLPSSVFLSRVILTTSILDTKCCPD